MTFPITLPPVAPSPRAEQLAALYRDAKEEFEAAKAKFEDIKAGLKAEMFNSVTDQRLFDTDDDSINHRLLLDSANMRLVLVAKKSWRLDTQRIKAERADIYAYYGKQTVAWELREGK